MKLKSQTIIAFVGLMAFTAMAQQAPKAGTVPPGAPDKAKVSYAQGMRIALITKASGANVDLDTAAQGLKDVLEGKPARFPESEMALVLRQGQASQTATQAEGADASSAQRALSQGVPPGPPDNEKFSYAVGNRAGLYLKTAGAELEADVVAQAFKDAMEGKPTEIQESEMAPLLQQSQAFSQAQQRQKNKAAGDAFLARNAKEPGITVLPGGLQYRVLRAGTGPIPATNDLIFIKCRGHLLNGTEFARRDHFLTRSTGGPKGWQDALQRMKVGSKWQIFLPPDLAFGHEGDSFQRIGPDMTVTYELELLSIAHPGDPGIGTGRAGHGLEGDALPPNS